MFGFKKHSQRILWRSDEAAVLTGGKNSRPWSASGVAINVDEVQPGDLFFAAHGDNLDAVFHKGASAAVIPSNMKARDEWACLRVNNTFEALRSFARAGRFKTHACVIAVQGEHERAAVTQMLQERSSVHEGGRHMSQGLAALPDDVAYGVFGFSPSVSPDIAVITDPAKAVHSRIFSAMPLHASVLMDMSLPASAECLAIIKASGLESIFDIHEVWDKCKIKSKNVRTALEVCAQSMMRNLSKIEPEQFAAFKVKNLIDIGVMNRTVILDSRRVSQGIQTQRIPDLEIPHRIDSLNLVYTSKDIILQPSLKQAVQKPRSTDFKKVVPEVLAPGDYMVFKKPASKQKIEFSSVLRMVTSNS